MDFGHIDRNKFQTLIEIMSTKRIQVLHKPAQICTMRRTVCFQYISKRQKACSTVKYILFTLFSISGFAVLSETTLN
jgi:hypothetical protein